MSRSKADSKKRLQANRQSAKQEDREESKQDSKSAVSKSSVSKGRNKKGTKLLRQTKNESRRLSKQVFQSWRDYLSQEEMRDG